jgi:hypothetical protein
MTTRNLALAALVLLAAGLRVWSTVLLSHNLRIQDPILDGRHYMELARRLSQGLGWPSEPLFMTPFYPFLLSLLFRVAPPTTLSVQIAQAVLGLAALALLFRAARRDLGETAAWAVACLYSLCGPVLGIESQVLTESLLFALVAAALFLWPGQGRRWWGDLLFGIICGLLTIGRGVFVLLPVAALLEAWLTGGRGRELGVGKRPPDGSGLPVRPGRPGPSRRAMRWGLGTSQGALPQSGLVIAAGMMMALLPLAVHQTRATGHLNVLTLNGGLNLYIGNNPVSRGVYSEPRIDLEGDDTAVRSASILAGRSLTMEESSRFWTRQAISFIRTQPGRAVWLWGRKAMLYLSPREIPQLEDFQALRELIPPLRLAFIDFAWVLPLAVLGVLSMTRFRRGTSRSRSQPEGRPDQLRPGPWLVLVVVGWIAAVVFFATGRYRVPFLPGFLGLAGFGLASLVQAIRSRRFRWTLIALPLAIGLQLLVPGYPAAKAKAYDSYQVGVRLSGRAQYQEALEAYREAARINPLYGEAWHGVGASLVQLGRLPEAVEAYREALQRIPNSARTHYNLGVVYGRMGDDRRALGELRTASSLDPYDPDISADLGVALARTGLVDEAIARFRQILTRYPRHEGARRGLAALGVKP